MASVTLTASLKGKPVVSLTNGEIIAKVETILINPNTRAVAALSFTKGGLLSRATHLIPADEVRVWGEDVILVSGPDIFVQKEDLSKVFIEGPVADSKRISVEATHALGPDVLVVDQTLLAQ
jgi:uncharacterized protein YrrD